MTFQINIEEIFNDDNLTISEKLNKLDDLKKVYEELIKQSKETLIKDYRYCPKCKEYYKKIAWENGVRSVTRQRCKNPLMGYLEKYEYEEVIEQEFYVECPKGHKIVDNYNC